jgi:hypothetical protein
LRIFEVVISVRLGHCDYSLVAPRNMAASLPELGWPQSKVGASILNKKGFVPYAFYRYLI